MWFEFDFNKMLRFGDKLILRYKMESLKFRVLFIV